MTLQFKYVNAFFPMLGADSSAKSHVNEGVELDDVPHEYAEVQEVDGRDTGNVIKGPVTPPFFRSFSLM